jgi:hypothetical protein
MEIFTGVRWDTTKCTENKSTLHFISVDLYVCDKTCSLGIFPKELRYCQINSIYKKGDKTDVANYRLISLLTSFSKIFKEVIFSRLQHHSDTNNVLAQEQYGFRTKLSTDLTNNILSALNNTLLGGGDCFVT